MSTVCPKCGNLVPDGINLCPQCGTPVAPAPQAAPFQQPQPGYPQQAYPQQGYPQPGYPQQPGYPPQQGYAYPVYAVPVAVAPYPQAPSKNKPDTSFGAFFSDFFKGPTDAINRRVHPSGWLFGLLSFCAYILASFLITLIEYDSDMKYINSKYTAASMSFSVLLSALFSSGVLVLLVMMFSSAFKIRSLDFLSSLSLSGLSMIFAFPCTVIAYINTKIMNALDENQKFISISSSILAITTVFLSIALFAYATQNQKPGDKRHKPVWFTICTVGCYSVCELFIVWLFNKIFFG